MLYLAIMVIVAVAGITRLWLQQRRETSRMKTVDGFREGLMALSVQNHQPAPTRPMRSSGPRSARPQPLDPARREAAKQRIEARRRARQRVA